MPQPIVTELKDWKILPPGSEVCQTCAGDHTPEEPHNPTSLYWNTVRASKGENSATWNDALAHCDGEIRGIWTRLLLEKGVDMDKPGGSPP